MKTTPNEAGFHQRRRRRFRSFSGLSVWLFTFLLSGCPTISQQIDDVGREPTCYTARSIAELRSPEYIYCKHKEILRECDEFEFIEDSVLAEEVVKAVQFYTKPNQIRGTNKWIENGSRYFHFIQKDFMDLDLCEHVAWGLPFVESGFRPNAKGPRDSRGRRALGMFQFLKGTATEFGLSDPFNWREASQVSALYVATLRKMFENSTTLALASYNMGPYRMFLALYASSKRHPYSRGFVFGDIYHHLPKETQEYPGRIFAAAILRVFLQENGIEALPR